MNIGIDLGGSHIGVGIVSNEGMIIGKKEISINKDISNNMKEFIIETIVKCINELLNENEILLNDIEFIGIGAPGEAKDGIIKKMVNLNIENFEIVKELKEKLNFENISVKNDRKVCGDCRKKIWKLARF